MARIRQRRPPARRPACNSPPRNGPIPPFPSTFTRRKSGRISWTQPKKPCRKSASSPRKPSMTRPRARPKPSCTLTRWRNRPPSSNPTRPAVRWRKRACICMEKSMRLSMRMWASRAAIREKNLPSAKREKPFAAASGVISSNPTGPQPRPRKRPLPPMRSTSTRNPCGTTRKWRRR